MNATYTSHTSQSLNVQVTQIIQGATQSKNLSVFTMKHTPSLTCLSTQLSCFSPVSRHVPVFLFFL